MSVLYDPIRKKRVSALPEERVRQALLHQMMYALGYPKGMIGVEKRIGSAQRRADIIVHVRRHDTLVPLVVIECKAELVDEEGYWQASGYNRSIFAPFICIAHAKGIRTYWKESSIIRSVAFLPPYQQLALWANHA